MSVLLLSGDLLFGSRVQEAARVAQQELQVVATSDALVERAAQNHVALVVLDLTTPGCDPAQLVPRLRELPGTLRILAFAPHVQTGRLDAAAAAGCDQVLTRGQFSQRLERGQWLKF